MATPYVPGIPLQGGVQGTGTTRGGGFLQGLLDGLGPFSFNAGIDVNTAPAAQYQQYWAPMAPVSPMPQIDIPTPAGINLNPAPGPVQAANPFALLAYQDVKTPTVMNQPIMSDLEPRRVSVPDLEVAPSRVIPDIEEPKPQVIPDFPDVTNNLQAAAQSGTPSGFTQHYQHPAPKADPLDEAYAYDQQHGAGAYERDHGMPPPSQMVPANAPQAMPPRYGQGQASGVPAPQGMNLPGRILTRFGDALNPYGAYQRQYGQYLQAAAADRAAARQQEMDLKHYEKEEDFRREMAKQRLVNEGNMQTEALKQTTEIAKTIHAGRTLTASDALSKALDVIEQKGATSGAGLFLAKTLAAKGFLAPDDHPEQSPLGLTVSDFLGAGQSPEKQLEIRKKLLDVEAQANKNAEDSLTALDRIQKQRYDTMQAGANASFANQNAAAEAQSKQFDVMRKGIETAVGMQTAPAQVAQPYLANQAAQLGLANTAQGMDARQLQMLRDTLMVNGAMPKQQRDAMMQLITERMAGLQAGALAVPQQQPGESKQAYQARVAQALQINPASGGMMVPPPPPMGAGMVPAGIPGGMIGPPQMAPVSPALMQQYPQYMQGGVQQNGMPPMAPPIPQQGAPMMAPPQGQPMPQAQAPNALLSPVPNAPPAPKLEMPTASKGNDFFSQLGTGMRNAAQAWQQSNDEIAQRMLRGRNVVETEISPQLNHEMTFNLSTHAAKLKPGATLTDPRIKERLLQESGGDARQFMALVKFAGWGDVDWESHKPQIENWATFDQTPRSPYGSPKPKPIGTPANIYGSPVPQNRSQLAGY